MNEYEKKDEVYFSNTRFEIKPLLPTFSDSVLEIGCGNGATLKWLKESNMCNTTSAIELVESMAKEAEKSVDKVYIGDCEKIVLDLVPNSYDLILCLDVLEHMIDPWIFIEKVQLSLKPNGIIVASIPNIRNANVIAKLVFNKTFKYESHGLLDKTHLRFFTKISAQELMSIDFLVIEKMITNPIPFFTKTGIFNFLTFGIFKELLTTQFLIKSIRK
jgi:2-polyprenyl-3-methyl-5-hydroxy-6-metoxy-1,4-benzoquinol methylase